MLRLLLLPLLLILLHCTAFSQADTIIRLRDSTFQPHWSIWAQRGITLLGNDRSDGSPVTAPTTRLGVEMALSRPVRLSGTFEYSEFETDGRQILFDTLPAATFVGGGSAIMSAGLKARLDIFDHDPFALYTYGTVGLMSVYWREAYGFDSSWGRRIPGTGRESGSLIGAYGGFGLGVEFHPFHRIWIGAEAEIRPASANLKEDSFIPIVGSLRVLLAEMEQPIDTIVVPRFKPVSHHPLPMGDPGHLFGFRAGIMPNFDIAGVGMGAGFGAEMCFLPGARSGFGLAVDYLSLPYTNRNPESRPGYLYSGVRMTSLAVKGRYDIVTGPKRSFYGYGLAGAVGAYDEALGTDLGAIGEAGVGLRFHLSRLITLGGELGVRRILATDYFDGIALPMMASLALNW